MTYWFSGERSLPFRLLVLKNTVWKKINEDQVVITDDIDLVLCSEFQLNVLRFHFA